MNDNNLNLAEVKDRVEFSGKYNILTNINTALRKQLQ